MGDEYSGFFVHPKLQDGDSIMKQSTYFEIPFRDHFYSLNTLRSAGVPSPSLLEIKVMLEPATGQEEFDLRYVALGSTEKAIPDNCLQHRRAAFVHTDIFVVSSVLEWIHSRQERYQDQFTDTVQNHLRDWLKKNAIKKKLMHYSGARS